MELTLRPATAAERLYAHEQSWQLTCQCGAPGYLYGELDKSMDVLLQNWEPLSRSEDTPEFQAEFKEVLNALRHDERYGSMLFDLDHMNVYCLNNREADIDRGYEYAFRADTANHAYLIRCLPRGDDSHVYIHPYRRNWLDRHMKQAEAGIRFIDPHYKELFRIPDGESIRILRPDGSHFDRVCRYIDECHLEVGSGLYHICELAEKVERSGSAVIPLRSSLPDRCWGVLPSGDEIVTIRKGENGYYRTDRYGHDRDAAQQIVDEYNEREGVSKAQAAAMLAGSLFGWGCPAADPKNYDEQGQPIKPRRPDRGDAR